MEVEGANGVEAGAGDAALDTSAASKAAVELALLTELRDLLSFQFDTVGLHTLPGTASASADGGTCLRVRSVVRSNKPAKAGEAAAVPGTCFVR